MIEKPRSGVVKGYKIHSPISPNNITKMSTEIIRLVKHAANFSMARGTMMSSYIIITLPSCLMCCLFSIIPKLVLSPLSFPKERMMIWYKRSLCVLYAGNQTYDGGCFHFLEKGKR